MTKKTDRRTFLAAAGATATTVALAGCSGGGDDGNDDDNGDNGGGGVSVPDEVDSYLTDNNTLLYEGEAVDETGSDEVSISVGAGDTGLAFDPPAVAVDAGTTITWEWTGSGGAHNVESADESATEFRSGDAEGGSDITFSQTFESGNQLYYCFPHRASGMHGAVIVQE